MANDTAETLMTGLAAGGIGFGMVAVATPRIFTSVYGLGNDARVRALTRLWGTRTAALGALLATAERPEDKRRLVLVSTALNAVDALLTARAPGVPARTRLLGSASSAGFAAAGVYVLTQG